MVRPLKACRWWLQPHPRACFPNGATPRRVCAAHPTWTRGRRSAFSRYVEPLVTLALAQARDTRRGGAQTRTIHQPLTHRDCIIAPSQFKPGVEVRFFTHATSLAVLPCRAFFRDVPGASARSHKRSDFKQAPLASTCSTTRSGPDPLGDQIIATPMMHVIEPGPIDILHYYSGT